VVTAEPVQEQERRPLADLHEGAPVPVDRQELDLVPSLVLELRHGGSSQESTFRHGPVAAWCFRIQPNQACG
jgi:hypothetical protein